MGSEMCIRDRPNTTHSLSPADRQLLGIPRMTHTHTDGPAQHDTLTLSSRPAATRQSSYDTPTHRRTCTTPHTHSLQQTDGYSAFRVRHTHTQTDLPKTTLTLCSRSTATQHSLYDTHIHRRTCTTPRTHSLQQTDGYSAFRVRHTHIQTDLPNTTHSLSPADRQLPALSVRHTHTHTDGPAQNHTHSLQQTDSYSAFLV